MSQPKKPDLFNAILTQGMTVHVDFNPQHPETLLPPSIRTREKCKLDFDYVRTRDMFVGPEGVSAGMTFGGQHYTVYVPWECVFCISFDGKDGEPRGVLYGADLPPSVATEMTIRANAARVDPPFIPKREAPVQASLQGGAKIYNLAEERARRAARNSPSAS